MLHRMVRLMVQSDFESKYKVDKNPSAVYTRRVHSICSLKLYRGCTRDFVLKFPRSRGVSGALYLQSAIAGVISGLRVVHCRVCPV